MFSRVAGRAITSPLAFLAAGLYDFCAFFAVFAWITASKRVRRRRG